MSCRSAVVALALVVSALAAGAASADISGFVTVEGSGNPGTPIAGAYVHIQADLVTPGTFTAAAAASFLRSSKSARCSGTPSARFF